MTREQLKAAGIDPPSPLRTRLCSKGGPKAPSDRKARERALEALAVAHGLPVPQFEVEFYPGRKWRFDILFDYVAVEVVGGVWIRGHHSRGQSQIDDMEKRNHAALLDYFVLEFTPQQVASGEAFSFAARVLQGETSSREKPREQG